MKILLSLLLLLTYQISSSQPWKDSLLHIVKSSPDQGKVKAYIALCEMLLIKDFDEAMNYGYRGKQLAASGGDLASVAHLENLIGDANYFRGNYDSAAIYYYQALGNSNEAGDKKRKGAILNSLGRLFRKTKNLDRSLENYNEALAIYKELNNEHEIATILNESGVVFEYKGDYDEALSRYKQSLKTREKEGDLLGISYSHNFIGINYSLQKKFKEAEYYLQSSLDLRKKLKDTFAIAFSYSDLAAMYHLKGDLFKAIHNYTMSNLIASDFQYLELLSNNYRHMSSIEEERGDHAKALSYFREHTQLKDSLFGQAKVKQIEELSARYNSEKKETQLKIQQVEIQKKNYLLGASLAMIGLIVFLAINISRRRQAAGKLKIQEAIMKEQESATRAVITAEENERGRIAADLHDGVGQMVSVAKMNMSAIEADLIFENENHKATFNKAMELVDESCREIRNVSHQMMPNALSTKGLANAVKEFLGKIDTNLIHISFNEDGFTSSADKHTETVLYRVIQECVNNVLKHAVASKLDISLIQDETGIAVTIEDNGKGFELKESSYHEGIGLSNIRSRIKYLKGSIDIDSSPGNGTLVAIHIPT